MDELVLRALRAKVEEYLGAAERLLDPDGGGPGLLELLPLVEAWRALLCLHRPGRRGRCRGCRRRMLRRADRDCSVWRTAFAHFVGRVPPRH